MKTPNSPNPPDEFYKELQDAKERYTAKIAEHTGNYGLIQYYEGRLDATLFLMAQFEIMFYEPKTAKL